MSLIEAIFGNSDRRCSNYLRLVLIIVPITADIDEGNHSVVNVFAHKR